MRAARLLSRLFVPGLLLFACALGFKWMKWPAGTILLIGSSVITLLGALMPLGKDADHRVRWAIRLAMAALVTYTVFRLMYWPGAMAVALGTLVLCALAVVRWWNSDRTRTIAFSAMLLMSFGGIALMATPVHVVYHYMFFETPGAIRFMHSGTGHWYRYSWFLYQDGQYDKSVAMLDSAVAEVYAHKARTGEKGEWLLVRLQAVQERIREREWNEFEELHR